MSIDGKCLDFWGVYDKEDIRKRVIHMEYYPEKSVIDLNQFFEDFFGQRDGFLKMDVDKRCIDSISHKIYKFTLIEFFEAFIGTYQPRELADFIEKHTLTDGPQSESFVKIVRNFDKVFYLCLASRFEEHLHVVPINLSLKEATKILSEVPKSTISPFYNHSYETRRIGRRKDLENLHLKTVEYFFYKNERARNKVREVLVKNKKPVILSKCSDAPELNYFAMIKEYNLPIHNLEIIRKK